MPYLDNRQPTILSPHMWLHALLIAALVGLVSAILSLNWLLIGILVACPLALITLGYGIYHPHFAFFLFGLYVCSFMPIGRYLHTEGLSVGVDILLVYLVASILIHYHTHPKSLQLTKAINPVTLSYLIWMLFTAIQFLNPGTSSEGIKDGLRTTILKYFFIYCCTSILLYSPKAMRAILIFGGIYTGLLFIKLMSQRYWGFDSSERYLLYVQGMARTHILHSGIRYFSFMSDASTFGTTTGLMSTLYLIISWHTKERPYAIFYLIVGSMALTGLLLSGTRSSLAIPIVGGCLYCLLCKDVHTFLYTFFIGLFLFVFLAFTDIGQGNQFIRRARTVIQPTEDASFNVRVRNRKEIAEYIASHPWGVGISASIPKLWYDEISGTYSEGTLPPDSHYVKIWIQNGTYGIILYVAMHAFWILSCCYIVLFHIRNKLLRQQLAAFTCCVAGLFVSGYANDCIDQYPNDLFTAITLAFVMNGPRIDRQLRESSQSPTKSLENSVL